MFPDFKLLQAAFAAFFIVSTSHVFSIKILFILKKQALSQYLSLQMKNRRRRVCFVVKRGMCFVLNCLFGRDVLDTVINCCG